MHQPGPNRNETPRLRGGFRPEWRTKAACRGYADAHSDPWDADPNIGRVNAMASSFCSTCPVKRECLLEGLRSDRLNGGDAFGIWGNTAPKQRRAMVRLRYREGCPVCKAKLIITPEGEEWQACASCGITWRCRKREVLTDDTPLAS